MAVSPAVRRYYAEKIFARSTRDEAPPNFRPLTVAPTGRATVEGCRGGGKNVLEVSLVGEDGRVRDVRVSCGLCNPAMYAAADIVADWARGRPFADVLAVDPLDEAALGPFFTALGTDGRPEDAREKLQYTLFAFQHAIFDHRGETPPDMPRIPEASEGEEGDEDLAAG